MALADVYDALISKRVYKSAYSHADSVKMISQAKRSHFDPDVVDAFMTLAEEFKAIAERFCDSYD